MCTYATVTTAVTGSAKGPGSAWLAVTDATVPEIDIVAGRMVVVPMTTTE